MTQNPEKLYKEWRFLLYTALLSLFIIVLFVVDLEPLTILLERIEPAP